MKFTRLQNILNLQTNSKMMLIHKRTLQSTGSAFHQAVLKFLATHGRRAEASQPSLVLTTAKTWHQKLDLMVQTACKTRHNCKLEHIRSKRRQWLLISISVPTIIYRRTNNSFTTKPSLSSRLSFKMMQTNLWRSKFYYRNTTWTIGRVSGSKRPASLSSFSNQLSWSGMSQL